MFHVYNFSVNPVCLSCQLRTYFHSITNFRFHIIRNIFYTVQRYELFYKRQRKSQLNFSSPLPSSRKAGMFLCFPCFNFVDLTPPQPSQREGEKNFCEFVPGRDISSSFFIGCTIHRNPGTWASRPRHNPQSSSAHQHNKWHNVLIHYMTSQCPPYSCLPTREGCQSQDLDKASSAHRT